MAKKTKVLVVDDNQGILFVIQKALEMKGYEVFISSFFAGIEALKKMSPDLLFLDISLADADGRAISQQIKKDSVTKHIPIIILTGHEDAEELARQALADDYLTKPFGLIHLFEKATKYAIV